MKIDLTKQNCEGSFEEEMMKNQRRLSMDNGLKLILQELGDNPLRKFNLAFSLTTVIPFLVFFYLLSVRLFTLNIFVGNIGFILFISIFVSLCGFCLGYNAIKNILNTVIFYAAQAQHSDRLKSTFVASVSHELKNPISTIKTNLFNMLEGFAGQVSDEQKKILEACHNVIERMNRLINDLLDLHKIEAGMIDLKRRLCNLVDILEKQVKEFELMFEQKRIKLIKEIQSDVLSVWVDEDKIMRMMNNLLSNAIKYTPEEGKVSLKIYPINGLVRLEFINSGQHIPPDKLEKIFDKFERLDITQEGTGLGLAITKDIVEMHKGKIWAESHPDKGNKFVVVLPCDLRKARK